MRAVGRTSRLHCAGSSGIRASPLSTRMPSPRRVRMNPVPPRGRRCASISTVEGVRCSMWTTSRSPIRRYVSRWRLRSGSMTRTGRCAWRSRSRWRQCARRGPGSSGPRMRQAGSSRSGCIPARGSVLPNWRRFSISAGGAQPAPALEGPLAAAQSLLLDTREDLARFSAGLHPRTLDELGLAGALGAAVHQSPISMDLEVVEDIPVPPDIQLAAYFFCLEGLVNIAKHASARRASVRVVAVGGELILEVADDGVGGATPGSGIQGIADRIGALGGMLTLESGRGVGTRLVGRVPLEEFAGVLTGDGGAMTSGQATAVRVSIGVVGIVIVASAVAVGSTEPPDTVLLHRRGAAHAADDVRRAVPPRVRSPRSSPSSGMAKRPPSGACGDPVVRADLDRVGCRAAPHPLARDGGGPVHAARPGHCAHAIPGRARSRAWPWARTGRSRWRAGGSRRWSSHCSTTLSTTSAAG